ncbi:hypothetical protein C1I98_06265 [Spongiactinospora gelatinilytica]|uniref:Uncharacterized protein n=1 Tax=Spongiactinospora gelatinilytica TaxID=2666298 RepID=A0A2W2GZA7_9ACTN|nr:hypothetical protein [Spongiactinospora gelatinilytica]PZG53033.1 hypothetical protein C1I98_06265 [Spongiactinospora gelatinilytica]
MTGPEQRVTNSADGSARVGVQAGVVHGDVNNYTVSPDAAPEEKFRTGLRYLEGGMARRARELIYAAFAAGHRTDEVWFHWLLALVSGRTRHELSDEETASLRAEPGGLRRAGDGAWMDGVRTVRRLLNCAEDPRADLRAVFKELDALGETQKALIVRHLGTFLEGPLHDQMWDRGLARARREWRARNRSGRCWKFFEPEPLAPRPYEPPPPRTPSVVLARVTAPAAVTGALALSLGSTLLTSGRLLGFLGYLVGLVGCYRTLREVMARRLRAALRDPVRPAPRRTPAGGFARKVDKRFLHYFAKYTPPGMERGVWMEMTAGVRQKIRDEIVHTYRESRVGVGRIDWLIRYRVSEVRERWRNGPPEPPAPSSAAMLGAVALLTVGAVAILTDAAGDAIAALLTTAVAAAFTVRVGLDIAMEHRRHAIERRESRRMLAADQAAFLRWRQKLADRPQDREMAAWLDCDRKILLNDALRHYKLAMSEIIAYGFIDFPAPATSRARVRGGPWRYRDYEIMLFLLTRDGVRQVTTELDFEVGEFSGGQRANYRFESIAAVRVRQTAGQPWTFELSLVNGQHITIPVDGLGVEELQQGEVPGTVAEATLDAAGVHHTLHMLEGIAASGKRWGDRAR